MSKSCQNGESCSNKEENGIAEGTPVVNNVKTSVPKSSTKLSTPVDLAQTLSIKSCQILNDMVKCPICLEQLKKPKMLPCQHTFCLLCIQYCVSNEVTENIGQMKMFSCPQCRMKSNIPTDGFSSLPSNIHVQSLLDMFESDKLEKESARCSSCQTFGSSCERCNHCNSPFCMLCLTSHVEDLKIYTDRIADQIQNSCIALYDKEKDYKDELAVLISEIKESTLKSIQDIKNREESLLKTVNEETKNETNEFFKVVKKLEECSKYIRHSFLPEFRKASSSDKIKMYLDIHKKTEDIINQVPKLFQTKLHFDPELYCITVVKQKSPSDTLNLDNDDVLSAQSERESPDGYSANEQSKFYRSRAFNIKLKIGIGVLHRPAGVAVCPWSKEIYVVSTHNHKINIFDNSGKFVRSFGCRGQSPGQFLCPFGIAFCLLRRSIIVSDKWKNCINEFNSDGSFIRQLGMKGRSPGHFRSPEGVATDRNGKIYVCDTGNDRLQVLNDDGIFLFEVGVKNSMEGGSMRQKSLFNEPTDVAVTPDGERIIVCDYGHHKIRVFQVSNSNDVIPSAELTLTLGTKGHLKGQFMNPECVAIDNQGFIIIGDSGNGRIQVCRPDGKVIKTYGTNKHSSQGHFSWISGIAVTDDYDIIVSDFKNHCVEII